MASLKPCPHCVPRRIDTVGQLSHILGDCRRLQGHRPDGRRARGSRDNMGEPATTATGSLAVPAHQAHQIRIPFSPAVGRRRNRRCVASARSPYALRPGFVVYRSQLSDGTTLDAFCTVSSLLPGTLPSGRDVSGGLAIHCLDVTQPVARQLAEEEALFAEALGERRGND